MMLGGQQASTAGLSLLCLDTDSANVVRPAQCTTAQQCAVLGRVTQRVIHLIC